MHEILFTIENWLCWIFSLFLLTRFIRLFDFARKRNFKRFEISPSWLQQLSSDIIFELTTQHFYYILRDIGCKHERFLRKNCQPKLRSEMKPADYKVLWKEYFDIVAIERTPKNEFNARIEFYNFIETEGVSISFAMQRKKIHVWWRRNGTPTKTKRIVSECWTDVGIWHWFALSVYRNLSKYKEEGRGASVHIKKMSIFPLNSLSL